MSRPDFPTGIVLPASCIQRIRSEQKFYDENTEYCERMQKQREEEREIEQKREYEYWEDQDEEAGE